MADALAYGAFLAAGLLCLKIGRSPVRLAIIALLHLRAVGCAPELRSSAAWERRESATGSATSVR